MATANAVAVTVGTASVTNNGTPSPSLPSGSTGDQLLLFVMAEGAATFTATGYSTLASALIGANTCGAKLMYKVRAAGEVAPVLTKTGGSSGDYNVAMCFNVKDAKDITDYPTHLSVFTRGIGTVNIGPIAIPSEDDVEPGGAALFMAGKHLTEASVSGTFSDTKGSLAWTELKDASTTVSSEGMYAYAVVGYNPLADFSAKGFGPGTVDCSVDGTSEREWLAISLNLQPHTLGIANASLSSATQAAAGSMHGGTHASTLGSVTQNASGTHTPPTTSGPMASTLGSVTQNASGTHTPPPVSGTHATTLGSATQSALAEEKIQGSHASTLDDVDHAFEGEQKIEGSHASTLDDVDHDVRAEEGIEGEHASTLDDVDHAMFGEGVTQGAMASTLDDVEASAIGHTRVIEFCCINSDPIRACGQESLLTQVIADHCVKVNQADRAKGRFRRNKVPRHGLRG